MIRATRWTMTVGVVAALLAGGCSDRSKIMWKYPHAEMETLSESRSEHFHRVSRVDRMDRIAISEDLDTFFMTDRPTRLSQWHSK